MSARVASLSADPVSKVHSARAKDRPSLMGNPAMTEPGELLCAVLNC
jgi:hypothetical protein